MIKASTSFHTWDGISDWKRRRIDMQGRNQDVAFEHEQFLHRSISAEGQVCITERHLHNQTWNITQKDNSYGTRHEWDETSPGFIEMDWVAHFGDSAAEQLIYTLTAVDLVTDWMSDLTQ